MSKYKLLCYTEKFQLYKKTASEKIACIAARDLDEFALLVCASPECTLGFNASDHTRQLLGALAQGSYVLADDGLFFEKNIIPAERRIYTFKPKDGSFQTIVKEYEKTELDTKKFNVLSRHGRACVLPLPTVLSEFLQKTTHPIDQELYEKLIETCHYVTRDVASGEHGYGAFEVFSDNLDVFFEDLKSLMGEAGELLFVEHRMLPYF